MYSQVEILYILSSQVKGYVLLLLSCVRINVFSHSNCGVKTPRKIVFGFMSLLMIWKLNATK